MSAKQKRNKSSSVKKYVIREGSGDADYPDGTKVQFHVKSETLPSSSLPSTVSVDDADCAGVVIDDSHEWTAPVELLLGKKFKMEIWEECVKNMKKGEISTFLIDKELVSSYPIVSQTLRKAYSKTPATAPKHEHSESENSHRCCGMGLKEGLGHKDLDNLVANPKHMKFTIELVSAVAPGEYEPQYWEMSEEERLNSVPVLQQAGNDLYRQGRHKEACDKYREAIGRLENLMLKEKPNDVDWLALNSQKLPLLLNFSQCQLLQGEYYSVVEHCSTVLQHQPDNVKALFRRGRAYVELCDGAQARADLQRCISLDPSTEPACTKLLAKLVAEEKKHHHRDKKVYASLFSSSKTSKEGEKKQQQQELVGGDEQNQQ